MQIPKPYLIFLADAKDTLAAKTGQGIVDWRRQHCVGQLRLANCKIDLGLPDLLPAQAAAAGARTLVIGTVSPGGGLPSEWIPTLANALSAGLNLASGMHTRLTGFTELTELATRHDRQLFDLRHTEQRFATGTGRPRAGRRLLTVGTDCSVGKKYTALALEQAMRQRGIDVDFRATGQTGILIAGGGIAIDAVVADFISGAAEALSPASSPEHWDVIEGQGSLFHPSFAGVSLGLLHGSQPDAFVVCHEPSRTTMRNVNTPIASIEDVINATVDHGTLTNPGIRCAGIAVNTGAMPQAEASDYLAELADRHQLPACDPLRQGVTAIVDYLGEKFPGRPA
jgi:uncharacterized NAD-dependent epimerase/dehydratase family protein